MHPHSVHLCVGAFLVAITGGTAAPQTFITEQMDLFETKIRPILVDNCYRCHGEDVDKLKGNLNLTYRGGLLTGGDRGSALLPGNADESLLIQAIEYANDDLQMPPAGKLPDDVISDFRTWVAMGAPDPRDQPFSPGEQLDSNTWEAIRDQRMKWWSFQPVSKAPPPHVDVQAWSQNPVDQFILAKLDETGLAPASLADDHAIIRRLTYVLTGLPPTPAESDAFCAAAAVDRQSAIEAATDRLLASPQFGERWARHWMDWVRYAETHGSEGDPAIPYAWRYRDYLIRALNDDVPYDQLVREHLAGDSVQTPRINPELEINESMAGPAQYRFVLHGYSPTDALLEQVRFTENQIDVISKGFLGLTVACARCHDHKFDPVSQKDFYALYGIMASSRPAIVALDMQERLDTNKADLAALKPKIRERMSAAWLSVIDEIPGQLLNPTEGWLTAIDQTDIRAEKSDDKTEGGRSAARTKDDNGTEESKGFDPLYIWRRMSNVNAGEFEREWKRVCEEFRASSRALEIREGYAYGVRWDLSGEDAMSWVTYGNGITPQPSEPGEFHIVAEGEQIIGQILSGGMYSHTLSDKHSAILSSPRFRVNGGKVFVRIIGNGEAAARYAVQNYPTFGETYPITKLTDGVLRWQAWDAAYWKGDYMYIEMATAADQPVLAQTDQDRSWFGITEALVVEDGQPAPKDELAESASPLFSDGDGITHIDGLAVRYTETLRECIAAWQRQSMTDAQARFLNYFVTAGLLPNTVSDVPSMGTLLGEYRRLEAEIPVPTRVPGVIDGESFDQPLFVRGDHQKPGDPIPRRFLEYIDDSPYQTKDAGRDLLAESILREDNSLTGRVIANRLWHHVFGKGIVGTPDNFGRLGEEPSHPELLDYLAVRFVQDGWSVKKMVRLLVTSRTFQLRATPSPEALSEDPDNRLLSHANIRRLEGEAIRDAMLLVAGELDQTMFGKPAKDKANRRSVYLPVERNDLDPFLAVFDVPAPVTTLGRRNATNVPAQSLAMMNSPFVIDAAKSFAARVVEEDPARTTKQRVARMFELALARPPLGDEAERACRFIDNAAADGSDPWYDFAHAVLCMKEFIYLN